MIEGVSEDRPAGTTAGMMEDQRSEHRSTLIYRASAVRCGQHAGFAIVKNVSVAGAMIRTMVPMVVGAPIVIELASGFMVSAVVRWRRADAAGVEFDALQPIESFLDGGGSDDPARQQRRMPRLLFQAPVDVMLDTWTVRATTCDISTHGLRLTCSVTLPTGPVTLVFPKLPPKRARLLWSEGSQAGCVFTQPFRLDELTTWLETAGAASIEGSEPPRAQVADTPMRSRWR